MTSWDRFWPKVAVTPGCWEWRAAKVTGYGVFWIAPRNWYAHRVAYEMLVGPIPDGLQLDHLCRNRQCVNPAHLEPVTAQVNTLRGEAVQAANAAKVTCLRGHVFDEANTYLDRRGSRCCRACNRDKMRARRAAHHEPPAMVRPA